MASESDKFRKYAEYEIAHREDKWESGEYWRDVPVPVHIAVALKEDFFTWWTPLQREMSDWPPKKLKPRSSAKRKK